MSHSVKRFLLFGVIVCSACIFVWVLAGTLYAGESGITPPDDSFVASVATSSMPARLRIPSISVDAHVQYVGTTAEGDMAVPGNYKDVGWYKHGTAPGQAGSSVIDGHVDNGLALPGVFKHLSLLRAGDSIYIDTQEGETLHFVVYDSAVYHYKDVPMEKIFERSEEARLNLITCDGSWVKGDRTYDKRLVIYARFAPS